MQRGGAVMSQDTSTAERVPQPIPPNTLFTLQDFSTVSGLKKTALRTARENGLKVRYMGNRAFVMSDDFFSYLKEHGKESKPKK
jgi:hypothetical protein